MNLIDTKGRWELWEAKGVYTIKCRQCGSIKGGGSTPEVVKLFWDHTAAHSSCNCEDIPERTVH